MRELSMDTTCHQKRQLKLPLEAEDAGGDGSADLTGEADIFSELQAFAETDEHIFDDDATASVSYSSDSFGGEESDDDASISSSEGESEVEESCCTLYDDEQDLACLKESFALANAHKKVRFSTVEIREYPSLVGDHPCSDSCPMTLDWRSTRGTRRDLFSYENMRFFRRRSQPRKLTLEERRRRIRETSRLSKKKLREMELQVAIDRLQDSMSGMSNFWQEIDEQQSSSSDPDCFWESGHLLEADV
jgi:hypothetical protein